MDKVTSAPAVDGSPSARKNLEWIVVCAIATGVLTLAAAQVPPRGRLIGLFSLAFGVIVGWLVVRCATFLEFRPSRRWAGLLAAMCTLIGLAAYTWMMSRETARQIEAQRKQPVENPIAARLIEQMQSNRSPGEAQAAKPAEQIKMPPWEAFQRHLSLRLQALGNWPHPWPQVFWCGELIAAAIGAAWMARRTVTVEMPTPAQNTAI